MMSSQVKFEQSSSTSSSQQSNCIDPLESMLDFSEYETVSYQSPSISPSQSSKAHFSRPVSNTPAALPSSTQQQLSGPSHNYDLYKQQTGIPQGAVANTLAVNEQNVHINNQYAFSADYLSGLSPSDDFVDYGANPRQASYNASEMEMEFGSSPEPTFFFPEQSFVNPSSLSGQDNLTVPSVLPTQSSNVGRLWPGMHQQQAALAKAQAQQKQQQQIIQQQRQNAMGGQPRPQQRQRGSHPPSDPIVEEKISQLLNSMRQNSVSTEDDSQGQNGNMSHAHRMRKEEEDMDEDERLLASEEGKKLSSKERRQLRNKVSARAFRSRRKEYIGQLEGEIAVKVNENTDLRNQNRALMEENTRLSDLTRMLLSSPSFSGFLDNLSSNPAAVQSSAPAPVQQQQQQQPQVERQVRKDVNPYAQSQLTQQHIGMTMIPEQTMDFSMLDLGNDGSYSYQPQVFSVLSMPETIIDASVLSGKASNIVPSFTSSDDEKVELPTIERMPVKEEAPAVTTPVVDEDFDNDPAFALFTDSQSLTTAAPVQSTLELTASLWAGLPSEKESQFTLVDAAPADESVAEQAMARLDRLCASIDEATARLETLTVDF
ncbi:BZIP-type transcription factor MBZ1 [Phlyctema vagabunda]|uniref:BZIP-type transcription factor MBZ1 n=1 Tax=Phlyctema vagabunda TaxID=108571 RepID=A0ABR4PMX5_9HELO